MNQDHLLIFVIASFALAGVILMKRESIPDKLRRPLAAFSVFMVLCSFVFIMIAFLQLGQD